MFEVKIYIETSMKGPHPRGKAEGWYAAVAEYETKNHGIKTREDFGYKEYTTYHETALVALRKSLKRLNKECILEIHTDSTYIINNIGNGNLKSWKNNNWKNIRGEDIKNKLLWQKVSSELDKHQVKFVRERRNAYSEWMIQEAEKIEKEMKKRIEALKDDDI